MLIKFESPACGSFMTTESTAKMLINLIGKNDHLEGIICSKEISNAIRLLKHVIDDNNGKTNYEPGSEVAPKARIFPFLQMLIKAEQKDEFVMWKLI